MIPRNWDAMRKKHLVLFISAIILQPTTARSQVEAWINKISSTMNFSIQQVKSEYELAHIIESPQSPRFGANLSSRFISSGIEPSLAVSIAYQDQISIEGVIATNFLMRILSPENFKSSINDTNDAPIEILDYTDSRNPFPTGYFRSIQVDRFSVLLRINYNLWDRLGLSAEFMRKESILREERTDKVNTTSIFPVNFRTVVENILVGFSYNLINTDRFRLILAIQSTPFSLGSNIAIETENPDVVLVSKDDTAPLIRNFRGSIRLKYGRITLYGSYSELSSDNFGLRDKEINAGLAFSLF